MNQRTHPLNQRVVIGLLTAAALLAALMFVVAITHVRDSGRATVADAPNSPFKGATMPKGVRAPDFRLTDQNGRTVTMSRFRGKPVVVTYLYTHCTDTCPLTAQMIRGALDDLGRDIPALAITVDPFRDTQASARAFLKRQHVDGRITFVLGKRRELLPVWKGFAIQPQLPQTEHQAVITLVDKRGYQRVADPVSNTNPEALAHDIRVLERERS